MQEGWCGIAPLLRALRLASLDHGLMGQFVGGVEWQPSCRSCR